MAVRGEGEQPKGSWFRRITVPAVFGIILLALLYGGGIYFLTRTGDAGATGLATTAPGTGPITTEPITTEPPISGPITTEPTNVPPTANAGTDHTVNSGASVSLDGTASSDPDGDVLTYAWSQTGGPSVTLTGANAATASFTAPTGPATLTFQLQVCDTSSACDTDSVTITVSSANDQLTTLYNAVKNTPPGKALGNKVKQIQAYVAANNKASACTGLNDFINLVKAQTGKKGGLTSAQAADFIAQANAIKTTLGC